jgi:hypothetical protein
LQPYEWNHLCISVGATGRIQVSIQTAFRPAQYASLSGVTMPSSWNLLGNNGNFEMGLRGYLSHVHAFSWVEGGTVSLDPYAIRNMPPRMDFIHFETSAAQVPVAYTLTAPADNVMGMPMSWILVAKVPYSEYPSSYVLLDRRLDEMWSVGDRREFLLSGKPVGGAYSEYFLLVSRVTPGSTSLRCAGWEVDTREDTRDASLPDLWSVEHAEVRVTADGRLIAPHGTCSAQGLVVISGGLAKPVYEVEQGETVEVLARAHTNPMMWARGIFSRGLLSTNAITTHQERGPHADIGISWVAHEGYVYLVFRGSSGINIEVQWFASVLLSPKDSSTQPTNISIPEDPLDSLQMWKNET